MDETATASNALVSNKALNPRPRKSWSLVWNDFTKERRADGSTVAICNHCKKQLTASSRSGTTHLKNHVIKCTSDRRDGRRKRKKLIVRRQTVKLGNAKNTGDNDNATATGTSELDPFKFDHNLSRLDLARMIILHRYPLSIVEDAGFRTFIKNLQPRFTLTSHEMVREDCMRIYENARVELYEVFAKIPSRASLTFNTWSSGEELDYVCLVCHFVDNEWKLQKKMLNLLGFGPLSTSEDLAKAVVERLHDWNIQKKISCMVLDNAHPHDEVADELCKFFRQKGVLISDGDFFHLNSCAHVFNLIIQEGLEQASDVINRVRECVSYVKSSPLLLRRFQEAAKQVDAPQKSLFVESTSSWTSTYSMLANACEFQDVFMHLAECDEDSRFLYPGEWDCLKAINECLDVFYQAMKKFSVLGIPTANLYFNDICGIHLLLKTWCISQFPPVASMASRMLKQFEEHWEVTRMVMAIASILDPRYKMKSIEYFFKLIYNSEYEAMVRIEDIRKSLTKIYNEYVVLSDHTSSNQALLCYGGNSSRSGGNTTQLSDGVVKSASRITLSDARKGLDQYLQKASSNQSIKTDLDMYLEEGVHPSKGVDDNFDVLFWWKVNAPKYPIVSMMARDILATPLSITGLDADGRFFPHQYLCSMDLITIQSLVCAHDWLKDEIGAANLDGDLSMTPVNQDESFPLSQKDTVTALIAS